MKLIHSNNLNELILKALESKIKDSKLTTLTEVSLKVTASDILGKGIPNKAIVNFTQEAWTKMRALIHSMPKHEIAWHGCVERKGVGNYLVTDILCYPQIYAAVTVESCDDDYPSWLDNLTDEQFNTLKLQGHSHVDMGVGPSGTDTRNWEEYTTACDENSFYILMIMNKRNEVHFNIIDKIANVIYENADCSHGIAGDEEVIKWAKAEIKKNLKEKKYVAPTYTGGSYDRTYWERFGYYTGVKDNKQPSSVLQEAEAKKKKQEEEIKQLSVADLLFGRNKK